MPAVETVSAELSVPSSAPYAETVSDYVRYELVRRNLGSISLGSASAHIAAIGVKSGIDALGLARVGHRVTVIDYDDDQSSQIRSMLDSTKAEYPDTARPRLLSFQELSAGTGERTYDLVLCHEVASYEKDPGMFVGWAASLVKPGGYLSVLEKGFDGVMLDLQHRKKHTDADILQTTDRVVNDMGRQVWAFRPRWLTHVARAVGATTFDWSGVCITRHFDTRPVTKLSRTGLNAIVADQERAGKRHDARGAAPFLHLIGMLGKVPTPR